MITHPTSSPPLSFSLPPLIRDMDLELAAFSSLEDRIEQVHFHHFVKQCLKQLLVPTTRTMAVSFREGCLSLADRSTIAPLVSCPDDFTRSHQVPTSDVSCVQPVYQVIQIAPLFLYLYRFCLGTGTDARPAAALQNLDPLLLYMFGTSPASF